MDKQNILIVFPTLYMAKWFFDEQLARYINVKQVDSNIYEYLNFRFFLCNERQESLRGRRADFVYLSDDCNFEVYKLILRLVRGDHSKIKVVM